MSKRGIVIIAVIALLFLRSVLNSQAVDREMQEIRELSGVGWCLNNDTYQDTNGDYINTQGWPCVLVSHIADLYVLDEKFCALVEFDLSAGSPDQALYKKDYKKFCNPISSGSWGLNDRIWRKYADVRLDKLQVELCNRFYPTMDTYSRDFLCP